MRFIDRGEAGRQLALLVAEFDPLSPVVGALPRGGVPVGYEVADLLHCPLDVILVRKVGLPGQPELAIGAVAEGGVFVSNDEVIDMAHVTGVELTDARSKAQLELDRRVESYRHGVDPVNISQETTVILVDDGLATGSTARAAVESLRARDPAEIWLAVPVAPRDTVAAMTSLVDRMIVAHQPRRFIAVGAWYQDFTQTTDDEVRDLLARSRER